MSAPELVVLLGLACGMFYVLGRAHGRDAAEVVGYQPNPGWRPPTRPPRPPRFPNGEEPKGDNTMVNLPDPYQVLCEKIIAAINEFEVATGRAIGDIGLRPEESDVCRTRVCRELIIDVLPKAGDPIR